MCGVCTRRLHVYHRRWSFTPVSRARVIDQGVLFSDDTIAAQPLSVKVPRYMRKYMDFFADLCQQEFGFQQYRPTLLAAAIILASRTALKITCVPAL